MYQLQESVTEKWINGMRSMPSSSSSSLQLQIQEDHVVLDNGVIGLTLSNPEGLVTEVRYNGIENVLEVRNEQDNRGYWDLNWAEPQSVEMYTRIMGTNFTLIKEDENQIEVSFTSIWNMSLEGKHVPLNIDRRFIMLSDCSGFYSYAIYEHLEGWPDFDLTQTRIAFKLREDMFQYMAISDERQRMMPMPEDRLTGLPLSYPEAVLLMNPTNPYFMGEVDDKYQYSSDNKDDRVHGWISSYPAIGFWIITPSDEFRAGGPFKQDLTCHVGPISLAMFVSRHYAGDDLDLKFREGPSWKKVLGPVFIYLNSVSEYEEPYVALWEDAKEQMLVEVQRWPYDFPVSEDFLCSDQRGTVSGRLLVQTNDSEYMRVDAAYVGLAPPGEVGSWQRESKGYQFWTKTDTNGSFSIVNARAGDYNLFAWVPGFIGDFRYDANLTVGPGCDINLGNIVYEPPRDGPTLWEIGIPDRSASEFYIPDPNPKYINKLYSNHLESDGYTLSSLDKFRQYGLWERYTDLYPDGDLIYTVGASYYRMDWFFAQFIRIKEDGTFQATTWKIKFKLEDVNQTGTYTLRLALASAAKAELQLRFNDVNTFSPHFTTGPIGKDNSIARHGIHGHEIVGIVVEVGFKVEKFKVGDKVGIGLLVSSCQTCEDCSNSLECYCPKLVTSCNGKCNDDGTTDTSYGGFSDIMVANMRYVVHIPDNLPLDGSAPLLCAGITVYSPMKYYGLTDPGMHVGVVGLGGLGHLAVKFAKAFGVKVTVISTSLGKKEEAIQRLGADSFLLGSDSEQLKAAIGTMDSIIDTVSSVHSLYPLIALLKNHGKLILVGLPDQPLELPAPYLALGNKAVLGSFIGGMKSMQEMLDFAGKHNITADVEVVPMNYVNTAMERLSKSDVRYRFVLDIANTIKVKD